MRTEDLHTLLDELEDTRELVLRDARPDAVGPPSALRLALQDEQEAYDAWCARPSGLRFAAYLAATDQSQAALSSALLDR